MCVTMNESTACTYNNRKTHTKKHKKKERKNNAEAKYPIEHYQYLNILEKSKEKTTGTVENITVKNTCDITIIYGKNKNHFDRIAVHSIDEITLHTRQE